jgi:uncharacterized damage-inducible protein DinB
MAKRPPAVVSLDPRKFAPRNARVDLRHGRAKVGGLASLIVASAGDIPPRTATLMRNRMNNRTLSFAALLTLASSARAQQPAHDPLATYLRRSYAALSKDLSAVVEMMPEQDFGFRPAGAVTSVRTFGEIVAHIAVVSAFSCEMGDGKPASKKPSLDSAFARDKARLIALVNETDARCTEYLATLTDTALSQVISTGSAPRVLQAVRGNSIVFAIVHANEHYGNLVTYLRARGLVPPPAAAQAGFLSLATPPKP